MKSINITAPINDLSYGVVSYNIIDALVRRGISVNLFPLHGKIEITNLVVQDSIKRALENKSINKKATSLRIYHQFDLVHHVGHGEHIGFPIFELDQFNDIEKKHLSAQDRIFVCSKWAQSILFENKIYQQSNVVPFGVDRRIFYPINNKIDNKVVFLNVGKWEIRKGHDILAKAFKNASVNMPDAELWMCNTNVFLPPEEVSAWEAMYSIELEDKVKFVNLGPFKNSQIELNALYNQADCGVFPVRAEGWNLCALEMMACGKHIITTNYSGQTEFCTAENSTLINAANKEKAYDGKWFFGQGNWADLDEDYMTNLTSAFISVYEKCKQKKSVNEAGIETAKSFTWEKTGEKIDEIVFGN